MYGNCFDEKIKLVHIHLEENWHDVHNLTVETPVEFDGTIQLTKNILSGHRRKHRCLYSSVLLALMS